MSRPTPARPGIDGDWRPWTGPRGVLDREDWLALLLDPGSRIIFHSNTHWPYRLRPWPEEERRVEDELLLLHLGGASGRFAWSGGEQAFGPGQALFLPALLPHHLRLASPWLCLRLRFRCEADGRQMSPRGGPLGPQAGQHLRPFLDPLLASLPRPSHCRTPLVRSLLVAALASLMTEVANGPACSLSRAELRRCCDLVLRDPAHPPAPATLARALGRSPDAFSRTFRTHLGVSPRRWIADERIRAASRALEDGLETVETVAARFGFANRSQFARRFRTVFGLAPDAWRRRG